MLFSDDPTRPHVKMIPDILPEDNCHTFKIDAATPPHHHFLSKSRILNISYHNEIPLHTIEFTGELSFRYTHS